MFGLILYAVFVAIGLAVTSTLLSYFIFQAVRTPKQRHKQDVGLTNLASETVG